MSNFVGYAMVYGFAFACITVKLIDVWLTEHC